MNCTALHCMFTELTYQPSCTHFAS